MKRLLLLLLSLLVACSTTQPQPAERLGFAQQALTGLVASYSFDAGTGTTAADGSGNGNTGTLNGATWTTSGKYGGALSFNGSSARVDIADANSLDLTQFTIAAWVKPTSLAGWRVAVLKENPSALGLSYGLYASDGAGHLWGGYSTSTATKELFGGAPVANAWQHIATTYDGSTLKLYKDGAQVASAANTGAVVATASPLRIGGDAPWGEYFAGLIDEVQLYSRALTAAEIVTVRDTPLGSSGSGGSGGAGGAGGSGGSGGSAGSAGAGGASGSAGASGAGGTGGAAGSSGLAGAAGAGGSAGTSSAGASGSAGASADITVTGSTVLQTMDGFGAAVNAHSWDGGAAASALDQLDTMGVRTWRVVYEMMDWEASNDDADPSNFNWTSYNALFTSPAFEELWSTIGYLNSKGYTSSVILNFMGRVPPWMGGSALNPALKDEFVETVVAVAYYGRVTRGLQFGQFEPINESDWDGIEGPQIGATDFADVMNRIAVRLDALGLSDLKLVGPDTAMSGSATGSYMPAMMTYPALMAHVDTFTIHQYSASSAGLMAAIAGSAYPTRHGWVSETDNVFNAWTQVAEGVNSVVLWEGYDSVYSHAILAGRGSSAPNDSGQNMGLANAPLAYSSGAYSKRGEYYFWEQLYRFVAPGAQRVSASASGGGIYALAFKHPTSGQFALVIRNDNGAGKTLTVDLAGVGSFGALQVYTTNQDQAFAQLTDAAISGGRLTVTVPYNSITTLTATPAGADTTPPVVSLQALTLQVASSDAVGVVGLQFLIDGVNLGAEDTAAPYSAAWTPASGSHVLSARARDAAGNVATKTVAISVP